MSPKNTQNSENFSKRFEQVLDGRSQSIVASKLNVCQNTISAWLRGEVPFQIQMLASLAKEFDVDLHWLITGQQLCIDKNLRSGRYLSCQKIYSCTKIANEAGQCRK